jgi:hypothetical protein
MFLNSAAGIINVLNLFVRRIQENVAPKYVNTNTFLKPEETSQNVQVWRLERNSRNIEQVNTPPVLHWGST